MLLGPDFRREDEVDFLAARFNKVKNNRHPVEKRGPEAKAKVEFSSGFVDVSGSRLSSGRRGRSFSQLFVDCASLHEGYELGSLPC